MHALTSSFRFGIVNRLRGVFFTVALVFAVSAVIAMIQLRSVERTSAMVTGDTLPVFVGAAELERDLRNLLVLLQQLDKLEEAGAITPLETAINAQIADIRRRTSDEGGVTNALNISLTEVESGAARILQAKKGWLGHRASLDRQLAELDRLRDRARDALEILTFTAASRPDSALAEAGRDSEGLDVSGAQNRVEDAAQRYHADLIRANTVTELTLETEAVIDAASGLHHLSDPGELAVASDALRFRITGLVVLLGRLDQSPERTELARTLAQIREIVLGSDGVAETAQNVQRDVEAASQVIASQIAPIQEISAMVDRWAKAARANVDEASAALRHASEVMILSMVISGIVAFSIIAAAVLVLVERQINRRMHRLTEAVEAIAAGFTDHEVDIKGHDELGRIAQALEVFRLNAQELRRSNAELEKFAYVAAHDLRSPLRAIRDLSDWVIEDEGTQFSEDGQDYMAMLRQRIERLNSLLSDLLEYSRVGKEHDDLAFVSVPELVEEISDMLDPDDHFNISYTGLRDPVATFATPLRHILLNLISNAIKHHDRPDGQIDIRVALDGDRLRCEVADDGPGIDPKYHDRVFALFQTLRPRDEVEGSGLGLAIIRKLLEHYGGSIRIVSNPDDCRGTTFIFDMPELSRDADALRHAA